jgi:lysyl-tRNA synthetase class 2
MVAPSSREIDATLEGREEVMSELEAQIANRRQKREALSEEGVSPYPSRAELDLEPSAVHRSYGELDTEKLASEAIELKVAGRVRALRKHGKTAFVDLHDGAAKLQLMVRRPELDAQSTTVLENLDLGDYAVAEGTLIRTRTGELTLAATALTMLAKAVRPLPEKWHGLTDVEARYRRRYLDLLFNEESRRRFEVRAELVHGLRAFLNERGFLEVETPMMQAMAGGAVARPFVTHHNALDIDLYLRIAPELYLKRLLVGGFHRVYEINRSFRNEGISTQHNPEFTMLEFYWAYSDYEQLISLTEEMISTLATRILGEPALIWKEARLDLTSPWNRFTMRQAISELGGVAVEQLDHLADLVGVFEDRELPMPAVVADADHPVLKCGSREEYEERFPDAELPDGWYGRFLVALFEETVEARLIQPTFITEIPVEVSPFAKLCAEDPRFTERFELFIGGMEIANAYSELNDPDLQAERFRDQVKARQHGDDEAHRFDEDYIRALEHGMPPAGGEGIGIDRLTMLFTNGQSIRDVILFPLLRPETVDD